MKKLIHLISFLALPLLGTTQHLEAGALIGAANYLGDLSNNSSNVYLRETKPAFGLFAKYNINHLLALKAGANYLRIAGRDANVRNDDFVRNRNLSFRTNILEFSLWGEFNFPGFQPYALSMPFSPYIFGGISFLKFTPRTRYQGNWVDLQPLGTEGQGMPDREAPYALNSFAIPFGIGVKYALSDKISLGLELGARRTFTDYLDDVGGTYVAYPELLAANGQLAAALGNRTGELSENNEPVVVETGTQRGDLNNQDWFFLLGATISYNFIDNGLMGSRGRSGKKSGCKTGF
ncbi:MAG TPA: hypothetical protein ENJ20_06250 [Bacteroidetes bacterium]|nr:hypothetical protein [Bacteroidota bacterium]